MFDQSGTGSRSGHSASPLGAISGFAKAPGRRGGRTSFLLKAVASIGLVYFILQRAEIDAVWRAMAGIAPGPIGLAVVCQLLGPAIIAMRWRGLLGHHGLHPGWPYLYRSVLVSGFFRQFMPSTIGGDVIRGYDAWRAGASKSLALMSLIVDRLAGLLALLTLAMMALLLSPEIEQRVPGLRWMGLALLAALVALAVMLARPRRAGAASGRLGKIGAALALYHGAMPALLRAAALSLLLQVNVITFYWALGLALGLPVSYADFYVIAPVAILVMMLPISINGIGVREGVFVLLLAQWGVQASDALALAWLEFGIFLLFGCLGGVLFALRRD